MEPLWAAHLDTCEHCQQTLQSMVASQDSWHGLTRHLSQAEPPPAALREVMANLKDVATMFGIGCGGEQPVLDLLDPPEQPGHLGRLAHYEISEVIGRGGMGIVLKGWDSLLHRVVAIKILAPRLAANEKARSRFVREARAAAGIAHDNVVTVHSVGEIRGHPYLVMQYITGMSVHELLERNGPLPPHEIAQIGMQTAAGLAAAHAQGLIHCDVKPENLLVEAGTQRVKVTDFGLTRALGDDGNADVDTIAGTPRFMSPEQARGEPLDPRTDLFSLGSVLYTLSTGTPPFQGATHAEVLRQVATRTPVPIGRVNPQMPPALIAIVDRLHARDRARRFASATAVVHAFEALRKHPWEQKPTGTRRRRSIRVAAAVFALLLAGLATSEWTGFTRFAATVFRIFTPHGVLVVEVDDPQAKVTIDRDSDEWIISSPGIHEFRLRPGSYRVRSARGEETTREEIVTVTRDNKTLVSVRLEAPVGRALATSDSFGVVARWTGHRGPVHSLAVSPDGKWVLSCGGWPEGDRSIRLWELSSGKLLRQLGPNRDQVYSVAFSPDGKLAVSGGEDHEVVVWDVATGEKRRRHAESTVPIQTVAFAHDGKTIIAGGADGKIHQWSVETGKPLRNFVGHAEKVMSMAFSPDDKRIVSGSRDRTARVWDVATGREIHRLEQKDGRISSVAFSPDGRSIATASLQIRIWDARSGELLRETKSLPFATNALAFSPDGRWIISGGYDTNVRLWDTASGRLLHSFADHKEWVWSVVFTPDGKEALSAGGGGRKNSEYVPGIDFAIRRWTLRPSDAPE